MESLIQLDFIKRPLSGDTSWIQFNNITNVNDISSVADASHMFQFVVKTDGTLAYSNSTNDVWNSISNISDV